MLRHVPGGLTGVEYSSQYGLVVNVGIQVNPDKTSSLIALGKIGAKEKELLLAGGMQVNDDMSIGLTAERLHQIHTFPGTSNQSGVTQADDQYGVTQDKVGVHFRFVPQSGPFKSVEAKTTYSQSYDKHISDRYLIIEAGDFFHEYMNHNDFVGAKRIEALMSGTMNVGASGQITPSIGTSYMQYNDGRKSVVSPAGGVQYDQYMGPYGKLDLHVNTTGQMQTA